MSCLRLVLSCLSHPLPGSFSLFCLPRPTPQRPQHPRESSSIEFQPASRTLDRLHYLWIRFFVEYRAKSWVARSTRKSTRRSSSSAPRKTIRCVNLYFPYLGNISTHHPTSSILTYKPSRRSQCLSVQCIYCQQIRAKNTSRQKQHLLECPGLRGHPNAPQPQSAAPGPNGIGPANGYPATPNGPPATAPGPGPGPAAGALPNTNGPMMSNGVNPHTGAMQTPLQNMSNRPPLPTPGAPAAPAGSSTVPQPQQRPHHTPKPNKPRTSTSNLPAPPLDDVHAAFVEFRAKEEDKVRMDILVVLEVIIFY